MKAKHVYMKGRNGWGLFYRVEDCLVFFTVYSVLVKEMGLCVLAFSIMFNHIHSLFKDISEPDLKKFQIRLATIFSREYNTEYDRTGPVFNRRFGRAGKHAVKKIIACIAYIFNNPVAGKMCRLAIQNRWTLLAYKDNPNPFSHKLVKRRSRHIVRDALKVVDIFFREGKYLGYATLRRIFTGLTPEEKQQVIDYIVCKYNFLSYDELEEIFGSFDKALDVVENITLPVRLDGQQVNRERLDDLIHTLRLDGRETHLPNELSGGQQQRVSIGRALINSPSVVLADEPTGNLDSRNSREIVELLRLSNQKYGQTLIVITHDESIALQADRIITVEDGHITRDEVVRG